MDNLTKTELTIARNSVKAKCDDINTILADIYSAVEAKQYFIVKDILLKDLRENVKRLGDIANAIERIVTDDENR